MVTKNTSQPLKSKIVACISNIFKIYFTCNTPIPHMPRIARIATNRFFIVSGGFVRFHQFFSPIMMFYESIPIQIRCRYDFSGESAQFGWNRAKFSLGLAKKTIEHAA